MELHGVYGRDISEFSAYPHEKEVLFVPGTCVRVIAVNDGSCVLQECMICIIMYSISLNVYMYVLLPTLRELTNVLSNKHPKVLTQQGLEQMCHQRQGSN